MAIPLQRYGDIAATGCRSLARHKLRSSLTALGLVIGVGCVIVVIAIGKGAAKQMQDQLDQMGTNALFVVPGATTVNGFRFATQTTFTVEDVDAIRDECPSVLYATPQTSANAQIVAGNLNWNTQTRGVFPDYVAIRTWHVARGAFFSEPDARVGSKVCVIGATVAENLFPDSDPIGQIVRIRHVPFRVIGVLERKGANREGNDQDDFVLAPFATVAKQLAGNIRPRSIFFSAVSGDKVDEAWNEVDALLRQRHRIPAAGEPDFTIHSQAEMAAASVQQMNTLRMLLLSIATVSLMVGGIGIMNIMLVSVTERTREIGIRMAVGAKGRHVLTQFLFEAMTISLLGGVAGILLGFTVSEIIAARAGWPVIVSSDSVAVAVGVAACVGVFFGLYPARKASRLDPIEALRYE